MQVAKAIDVDLASIDVATARQTIEYICSDLERVSGLDAAVASLKVALDALAAAEGRFGTPAPAGGRAERTRRSRLRLVSRAKPKEPLAADVSCLNFRAAIETYIRAIKTSTF